MRVLAFDPGDTTGIAIVDEIGGKAQVVSMLQLSLDELIQWAATFDDPELDLIIYERFIVFRQKAKQQTGSKMKVSQAIGVIKTLAARMQVKLVEQGPDIKRPALAWSGIKMPSAHSQTHQFDAFLHAYYWLHKNGMLFSRQKGIVETHGETNKDR